MQLQPAVTLVDADLQRRSTLNRWLERAGCAVIEGTPGTTLQVPDGVGSHCFLIAENSLPSADPAGNGSKPAPNGSTRRDFLANRTTVVLLESLAPMRLLEGLRLGIADAVGMPVSERELVEAVERALVLDKERRGPEVARRTARERLVGLSKRERQVLHGILEGHPNRRIGDDLGVSVKTIESHRSSLMRKAGCRSLACLVRLAVLAGEGTGAEVPPVEC
jgi:FixJ family two-component response regulator